MEFQFSFETNRELIIIDGQLYINPIGTLLQSVLDIDWSAQQKQLEKWERNEIPKTCWYEQISKEIEKQNCHPVIKYYLEQAASDGTVDEKINTLARAKKILLAMLEAIVDEDRSEYDARLYEQFYEQAKEHIQAPAIRKISGQDQQKRSCEDPDVLSKSDQNDLYATKNLTVMLCLELRQLCLDLCIIRKCANCRRFFWTHITKKIYCNRTVPGRTTTCSKYGPQRKYYVGKRPAFNLYWKYRTKVFQRMSQEKDRHAFHAWVKITQPYKEAARRGEISVDEMKKRLEKAELKVFPAQS